MCCHASPPPHSPWITGTNVCPKFSFNFIIRILQWKMNPMNAREAFFRLLSRHHHHLVGWWAERALKISASCKPEKMKKRKKKEHSLVTQKKKQHRKFAMVFCRGYDDACYVLTCNSPSPSCALQAIIPFFFIIFFLLCDTGRCPSLIHYWFITTTSCEQWISLENEAFNPEGACGEAGACKFHNTKKNQKKQKKRQEIF